VTVKEALVDKDLEKISDSLTDLKTIVEKCRKEIEKI
jgi:hypothetical protein